VVEQRFGPAVTDETKEKVIGETYPLALRAHALEPISEGHLEDVRYELGQELTFSISFDVQPTLELGRLGGFTVQRPRLAVAEDDLDRVLARLRDQHGVWKPEEGGLPEEGNLVALEIQRLVGDQPEGDSRPYEIVLGDGEALPDVEAAVRTLAVEQTGDFTVVFPDDFPDESRRGQKQHLRIAVQGRKTRELPDLTDEFARSLGDFQDLAALRARVREDLEREAADQAEAVVRGQLVEQLLEANPFQIPRSMAERYLDTVLGDTSKLSSETLARTRESLWPEAEKAVKRILLVDRVAQLQGLRATEAEVDERVQAIAARNNAKPAQVYASLQKSGSLEGLEREITEGKVYEFLKSQSTVQEV
jgi:trigger factor